MGAASSTGSAVLQSSAQQAATTAALPQEILHTVFSSADFNDFLQLSTVAGCSKYVFQTKKAMDAVFTELRLEPTDTEGIHFAPVDRLTFTRKNNPTQAQDIQKRNTQCMKVAYFYIRIFQIYGALAITVLDTIPTRELATGTVFQPGTTQQGQIRRPMIGGADADKQLPSGKESKFIKRLPSFFYTKLFRLRDSESEDISMSYAGKKKQGETDIILVESVVADNETTPTVITIQGKHVVLVNNERKELDVSLVFVITDGKECVLAVNGKPVQPEFLYETAGIDRAWGYKDADGKFITSFSEEFVEAYMTEIFNMSRESSGISAREQKTGKTVAALGTAAGTTAGAGVATGAKGAVFGPSVGTQSEFIGLASLTKKLLRDKHFPKAYAVARAMQLLNPALSGERVQGTVYRSDVCRTSQTRMLFNTRDKEMPVIDSEANSSIYFTTLTALFYDKLEIKPDGSPTLSQTSPGREALIEASQQLGALFQFPQQEEAKFLFDKKRIPPLSVCKQLSAGGKITPMELEINVTTPQGKVLVKELQGVVQQLLKLQKEHSARVLQFYQSMFAKGADGRWTLRKEIYRGGIPTVNRLAEQARMLLLLYYKKSEALYTIGYSKLYQARTILRPVAVS